MLFHNSSIKLSFGLTNHNILIYKYLGMSLNDKALTIIFSFGKSSQVLYWTYYGEIDWKAVEQIGSLPNNII